MRASRCARRLGALSPAEYFARHGAFSVERKYEPPDWIEWDDHTYRGDAYATYGWGCDVAELEIDPDTFEVRPIKLTAVQEFGRPIHPALARGQIEGGTAQGLGYALLERVVMRNGAMANAQLTNYTIPTTLDTPEIDVVMLENPYPGGPFGAKGLGELPMDGPAPAVANALRHLGLDVREIPATPELLVDMRFTLNGAAVDVDAHPMARLLDVLRDDCGLTGTKEGCGEGECGACTVLIDGAAGLLVSRSRSPRPRARRSSAIEGLGDDHPLQHLFMNEVGAQCGICTPGMIMAALSLGRPDADARRREDRARRQSVSVHRLLGDLSRGAEMARGETATSARLPREDGDLRARSAPSVVAATTRSRCFATSSARRSPARPISTSR